MMSSFARKKKVEATTGIGIELPREDLFSKAEALVNANKQTEFFNLPGEIESYNDITKIGCAYRTFLSSIMKNNEIDGKKQEILIFHVRSILYCYIINIGFKSGAGNEYFTKAKNFFTATATKNNSNILETGKFNSTDYDKLFKNEKDKKKRYGAGSYDNTAYYPELLNDNKFVDVNGSLKEPNAPAPTGGRSRRSKKRKTTKKKRIKRSKTTKKKRVKRRKYSLKK